jgi:thiol-disulfide isomerase/thioredoxin
MLKKQTLIRVLIVLVILGGATHLYFRFRVAPALLLPEIQMQTLKGESVNATQGQATILIFFATWCPDCRRELPVLSSLEDRIKDLDIRIMLVSDESVEKLQQFSSTIPARFELVKLKGKFSDNGIHTLPTSYLFCQDGTAYLKKTGAIEWTSELLEQFTLDCPKK